MTTSPCPVCPGLGHELGALGRLIHFRCRDCGMQFSQDAALVDEFQDEDEELEAFEYTGTHDAVRLEA